MRIMQCWDDGDVDDIRLVEILKKHDARATFNINPGGWKSKRREAQLFKGTYQVHKLTLDELPQVYEGFCIGGHTMTHPLLNAIDPMALHTHCHFLAADFWQKCNAVKAIDGDFYFWGHTFELMGDDARWQELDTMIGRLSDEPATEWIDVKDMFANQSK